MDKNPKKKNMSASVLDRLRKTARGKNEDFNRILTRFVLERFLFRLSSSPHADQFVVKGAMMLVAWMPGEMMQRPTRDLDLLGHGSPNEARLERTFREVCAVAVADDGIFFDPSTVKATSIMSQQKYRGIRVELQAVIGKARNSVQIDVGFGGTVSPTPVLTTFPTLLSFEDPQMMGYRPETAIAEKFQAMVEFGLVNGRMKDFFDIAALSNYFEFDANDLWTAISKTFTARETPVPVEVPLALTPAFAEENKQRQWAFFVKRSLSSKTETSALAETVEGIRSFLWPLIEKAREGAPQGHWQAGGPWTWTLVTSKQGSKD